ncbi:MAG TPA: molybdate ABC transporter substrate-binding protein [Candidatus Hydrogenedentes bacterium]|nr:molybdate ABC transporter substrate-binding protein [Candidatus Hydrogenedentota bacterium]
MQISALKHAGVVLMLGALAACGNGSPAKDQRGGQSETGKASVVTLFCGAGIRPAAESIISAFKSQSNVDVRPTYAGSEVLLTQINAGAPGDCFMPGAEEYVDRAVELGLADPSTKRIAAYFIPVIFVQKSNPKKIQTLSDLAQEGLRLGLGDERACAIGEETVKLLKKNQIPYETIEKNLRYKSATVNELPMQIQLGALDAVVCWDATARQFEAFGDIIAIPLEKNVISAVPLVRLKRSTNPEATMAFIEFVTSEAGKALLGQQHYSVELPK